MAKNSAVVFGTIFLIAGIWGFVSSPVLGVFAFGSVGNVIHIIAGIILLAVATKPGAIGALKTMGIIYLIFFVLSLLNITVVGDSASGWLYFILGAVMAIIGFSGKRAPVSVPQA